MSRFIKIRDRSLNRNTNKYNGVKHHARQPGKVLSERTSYEAKVGARGGAAARLEICQLVRSSGTGKINSRERELGSGTSTGAESVKGEKSTGCGREMALFSAMYPPKRTQLQTQ